MSHWAELDNNNKVLRVLVGDNNEPDEGEAFMNSLGGTWVKTSYNSTIRHNFAGIGFTYDPDADAFIASRPECGHKELFLNDNFKWNCQRCELDIKAIQDEA
jgi:hypothetical protein